MSLSQNLFFNNWGSITRTAIAVAIMYCGMVIVLRISGKRTLTRLAGYEMIVPLALGPILSITILTSAISIADGLTAFSVLVLLHFLLTWFTSTFPKAQWLIIPPPRLVYYGDRYLEDVMRKERFNEREVEDAVRLEGCASMREVMAVVVESNGSLSVIRKEEASTFSALKHVSGFHPGEAPGHAAGT